MRISIFAVALLCAMVAKSAAQSPAAPKPKATLYVFFATWCVPCRVEIPHIERMHRTYKDQGLAVTLVSEDAPSTAPNIPAFLARFDTTASWVIDAESELLARYHPAASVPYTVLLDQGGSIVYAHAGYEPGDERKLEAEIIKQLAREVSADKKGRVEVTAALQTLGVRRRSRFSEIDDGRLDAAVGRLEVTGRTGRYSAYVRVDGAVINDLDDMDGLNTNDNSDANLERITVEANFDKFRLRAGDGYAAFGHGVSLSLRKVDPLGLDTSLRGGRVDATFGNAQVTALVGVANPQSLDPIEFRLRDSRSMTVPGVLEQSSDLIAGSEVTIALGDKSKAGPYVLFARAREASPTGEDIRWTIGGASATIALGDLRLVTDVAAGERTGFAVVDETPYAVYTQAVLKTGDITTLVEGKVYRHWEFGRPEDSILYHEPPNLEREDQQIPGNKDVAGGRARVEWRLHPQATVFANIVGYRFSQNNTSPFSDTSGLALHGYAGGELRIGDDFSGALEFGYREHQESNQLALWHVDVDVAYKAHQNLALTFKINHRSEQDGLLDKSFVRGLSVVGAAWPGIGTLSFLYGYSTEFAARPVNYPAGELRIFLPRGGDVRLFAGRLSGGRICVSGTCRDLPPFEGVRLELLLRY